MSAPKSRWENTAEPETEAILASRKREKEAKRRAKAERQRKAEDQQKEAEDKGKGKGKAPATEQEQEQEPQLHPQPPTKRRRLSHEAPAPLDDDDSTEVAEQQQQQQKRTGHLLTFPAREWGPCRHVDNYERLNHIEEGSYGWVSRAKDISTGEIVALKKLKMENSQDGFPVTGLREIQTLLESRHSNIVNLREIVMGTKMDE